MTERRRIYLNEDVYQLIYTSVQHSLSDAQLGLVNEPGMRVYSCSLGVTRENIEEITRFASYKTAQK